MNPGISIVMPCLNEGENVAQAIESSFKALERRKIDGELVVVNDGSTDNTRQVVEGLMATYPTLRLLNHEKPCGIGASFLDGVGEARMSHVVMFPGDNENDPDDALTYFYLTRDVDILIPFIHNQDVRSRTRRIISSVYRFVVNMSFGLNLNYTNGTVIYNTAILREIDPSSTGFFYQAECLITLIRKGYLYAETPHFLSQRSSGTTNALTLKSLLNVIRGYLRLTWLVHVKRSIGKSGGPLLEDSATMRRIRQSTENDA